MKTELFQAFTSSNLCAAPLVSELITLPVMPVLADMAATDKSLTQQSERLSAHNQHIKSSA